MIVDPYLGFLLVNKRQILLGIDDLESVDIAASFLEKCDHQLALKGHYEF